MHSKINVQSSCLLLSNSVMCPQPRSTVKINKERDKPNLFFISMLQKKQWSICSRHQNRIEIRAPKTTLDDTSKKEAISF